jgi:hypothetical protein
MAANCKIGIHFLGKGLSNWDTFTHKHQNQVADNSTGDISCDSYHLWQNDLDLLQSLGVWSHYDHSFTNQSLLQFAGHSLSLLALMVKIASGRNHPKY